MNTAYTQLLKNSWRMIRTRRSVQIPLLLLAVALLVASWFIINRTPVYYWYEGTFTVTLAADSPAEARERLLGVGGQGVASTVLYRTVVENELPYTTRRLHENISTRVGNGDFQVTVGSWDETFVNTVTRQLPPQIVEYHRWEYSSPLTVTPAVVRTVSAPDSALLVRYVLIYIATLVLCALLLTTVLQINRETLRALGSTARGLFTPPAVTDEKALTLLERALVIIGLALLTGAFIPMINYAVFGSTEAGVNLIRVVFYGLYALTGLWALTHWRPVLMTVRRLWPLWIFVALFPLSALWSTDPWLTATRSMSILGTSLVGVVLITILDMRRLIAYLGGALALCTLTAAAAVVLYPEFSVHDEVIGGLRGHYVHKNFFGPMLTLSIVTFTLLMLMQRRFLIYGALTVLALGLLAVSNSLTGVVLLGVFLVALVLAFLLRLPSSGGAPFQIAAVALVAIALLWIQPLVVGALIITGRSFTLTGRFDVWLVVLEQIPQHPWLGIGYAGFLIDRPNRPVDLASRLLGWEPNHPHNLFIGLTNDLGIVGAFLFTLALLWGLWRALRFVRAEPSAVGIFPLVLLLYALVYSLVETNILRSHDVFWPLLVATYGWLARPLPVGHERAAEPQPTPLPTQARFTR